MPEAFYLDEAVKLILNCQPASRTQYPIVYRIESPGFAPSRIPIGSFNERPKQEYDFKAGEFDRTRISVTFYHSNSEAGHMDFDFIKSDGKIIYRKIP